jgi:inorganic pyrophosphatase
MLDFDAFLAPYAEEAIIHTVVEIPKGSMHKVEFDRENKVFMLDRVEPSIFAKPVNYGFIPGTLDEDGDALDTLIITDEPLPTGIYLKARVIGILNFEDDGEMDHKVLCVPEDDRNTGNAIKSIDDVSTQLKKQIEYHFNTYKDLKKPGTTKVLGWGDEAAAHAIIKECINAWSK